MCASQPKPRRVPNRGKRGATRIAAVATAFFALFGLGCNERVEHRRHAARAAVEFQKEPIQALPRPTETATNIVKLGGRLFHDPRLSSDGTISCASCHDIAQGGDDGKARSVGIGGALGGINAPSVLNAGFNFVQFWDGRAQTLEDQVGGPITHPKEMASTWASVVQRLQADKGYTAAFAAAFPDGVTEANVRAAISAFERTLVTVDSRFDRWLAGEKSALNADETAGYERFKTAGCIACHQGQNVGGNMFQRFGVMGDYFADRGNPTEADLGRFNVTKSEADKHVFRVPSLRNVELTAPYFHDGSAATLPDAVRVMAKYQLGRPLSENEVGQLVAFLKTLTGTIPDVSGYSRKEVLGRAP
jgi:cytochrome c peroxidase